LLRDDAVISPDERPLTLKEAADLYHMTVSTLRAEADRGRLEVFRIGKRDYTTLYSLREMVKKCRENDPRRASTLTQNASSGLSETEQASAAQAALKQTVLALRSGLPPTSGRNGSRKPTKVTP
jgi:hypothetical protein